MVHRYGRRVVSSSSIFLLAMLIVTSGAYCANMPSQQQSREGQATTAQTTAIDYPALMTEAQNLFTQQKFDEADGKFADISKMARSDGQDLWVARAEAGLGSVAYRKLRYPEARKHYLEALAIFERLGERKDAARATLSLGNVSYFMGDLQDASSRYESAAQAYQALGDVNHHVSAMENFLKVQPYNKQTQELFDKVLLEAQAAGDKSLEASILHDEADRLFQISEYEQAIEKLTRAGDLALQINDRAELGTIYNSLGRLYRSHRQTDMALQYQLKALEIQESLPDKVNLIQSLNAVAVTYDSLGNAEQALHYYERALALADATGSPRLEDFVRGNFAGFLVELGENARGAAMLEEALARGADRYKSARLDFLSLAYRRLGRYEEALDAAQKAMDTCGQEETSICLFALKRRAEAHLALGNTAAAASDLQLALEKLEAVHSKLVPEDFLKQDFHQGWESLYSLVVDLDFRQGKISDALTSAEMARSRAFLDLLAAQQLKWKERDQVEMAALQRAAAAIPSDGTAGGAARSASFSVTLRGGTAQQQTDVVVMQSAPPELRSLVTAASASATDIASTASRLKSTFLIYWVADDALYTWVVSPSGEIHGNRVAILRTKLIEMVAQTVPFSSGSAEGEASGANSNGAGATAAVTTPNDAWRQLDDTLIEPIRKYLPRSRGARLTIVPHGPLMGLSFAALPDAKGRYLLEDYRLHYVPASAVLLYTANKRRPDARKGQFMLIADPDVPPDPVTHVPFPRLPGSRAEAARVAALLPASHILLLNGEDANETHIREAAPQEAVLHFATHAVVRDEDPFNSFLALSRAPDGSSDGFLTAREIYSLDLNADLVVLSSCRSGGGRINGDGIAALSRAFFYAGTPSLVVSLWDVADQPANRLLPEFYRVWLRGEDKDSALRAAQLRLIRDLRAGKVRVSTPAGEVVLSENPAFWAGFVVVGEPD